MKRRQTLIRKWQTHVEGAQVSNYFGAYPGKIGRKGIPFRIKASEAPSSCA